jgi:hypothetical protein
MKSRTHTNTFLEEKNHIPLKWIFAYIIPGYCIVII